MARRPNDFPLTLEQHSILLGIVLGDGCLHKSRNSPRENAKLTLDHGLDQKEWVWWQYLKLQNLFRTKPRDLPRKDKRPDWPDHVSVRCTSQVHTLLTVYYDHVYARPRSEVTSQVTKKRVTQDMLVRVDDLALAVWFGDDGSRSMVRTKNHHTLHMNLGGLSSPEYVLIQDWFESKGMVTTMVVHKDTNCVHLNFNQDSGAMDKLRERIRPHLPACMQHKIHYLEDMATPT